MTCVPKKYPAYTIDDEGVIRAYYGVDAWNFFFGLGPNERRVCLKGLPSNFEPDYEYDDYDV